MSLSELNPCFDEFTIVGDGSRDTSNSGKVNCAKYALGGYSKRIWTEALISISAAKPQPQLPTSVDSYNELVMAQYQALPFDDTQLQTVSTVSTPATPRRLTMPTFTAGPTYAPRYSMRLGNGACTHLTMTRLYTDEYRCSMCLRTGPLGWVYRCTQDRELLIEEDMENGNEVS